MRTFGYTNHTLLPEALENWPVPLFAQPAAAPPRDHLRDQPPASSTRSGARFPGDEARVARLSHHRRARRAVGPHGATSRAPGSHAINGVAALHTDLLKRDVLPRLRRAAIPSASRNVTNGVTPRRFLALCNPGLAAPDHAAHRRRLGPRPRRSCVALEPLADDAAFRTAWRQVKHAEQGVPGRARSRERTGVAVDPASLFDIQVKRIHEYKRQHLNVLHILTLYRRLKQRPDADIVPRTFIFGGKAAPGYCDGEAASSS